MKHMNYKKSEYFSESFIEILDSFFAEVAISESSMGTYISRLRSLCDTLKKDFLEIGEEDVDGYFSALHAKNVAGQCKKSSIYSKWTCFNRIADYVTSYLPEGEYENPFSGITIDSPSPEVKLYRIPTTEDVDKILSKAPNKMYYLVFVLAFRTALTLGEIVDLRISSLAENEGKLFVQIGNKGRILALSEDVSELLQDYISTMPYKDEKGHLFYNQYNNPLTGVNVRKCFRLLLKKLDLDATYSMKDLRNRCMLDMISSSEKSGLDTSIVADYAGIGEVRLRTLEKSAVFIRKNPADLVNIRVNKYDE